jgi:hypothetical protein
MKVRVGQVKRIVNKDKRNAAKEEYYAVILNYNGQYNTLLFTELEFKDAFYRSASNAEDCLERSFISNLID